MKKNEQFFRDMQRYIAVTTVGPSALRNQGSKGVIKAAQQHLATIKLSRFRKHREPPFIRALDEATTELKRSLPKGAQNWGAARKALNLFLRDICYNRFLSKKHGLSRIEPWMEIPLDSLVALALKRRAARRHLPPWPGLNGLTPRVSAKFQAFAKRVAADHGISRVHLDMHLWTRERERTASNTLEAT